MEKPPTSSPQGKKLLEQVRSLMSDFSFRTEAYKKILENLVSYFENKDAFNHTKFFSMLPPELFAAFDRCYLLPLPTLQSDEIYTEEVKKVVSELKTTSIMNRLKVLGDQIQKTEKDGDDKDIQILREEFSHLVSLLPS